MKDALIHARKQTLCMLAQSVCGLIRRSEAILTLDDVQAGCGFVAGLCDEAGCEKSAESCMKASEAETEKEFQKNCSKSCGLCNEERSGKQVSEPQPNLV